MGKTQADYQSEYIKFLESALESSLNLSKALVERERKELSDDEIEAVFYKKCWYYDEDEKFDYYGFAKEILKKANER